MKKRAPAVAYILVALMLASPAAVPAQKNGRAEGAPADASLEASLDRLERELRGSVAVDFRQRYARRTYVRLKRRGGCDVSFRVSDDPPGRGLSESATPAYAHPHPYAELRVSLSDLDPYGVRVERSAKGDYAVISFATLGGKESIRWEDFERQKAGWLSGGRIEVGGKDAPRVAEALGQAIASCRE